MSESTLPEGLISIEQFAAIRLQVGIIRSAEAVPKSKKLLRLEVDLAEEKPRQILAGIAQFYDPEMLKHRKVVVVANLKPAKLMGLESQGMLLAAADESGERLSLVYPGDESVPGMVVR